MRVWTERVVKIQGGERKVLPLIPCTRKLKNVERAWVLYKQFGMKRKSGVRAEAIGGSEKLRLSLSHAALHQRKERQRKRRPQNFTCSDLTLHTSLTVRAIERPSRACKHF